MNIQSQSEIDTSFKLDIFSPGKTNYIQVSLETYLTVSKCTSHSSQSGKIQSNFEWETWSHETHANLFYIAKVTTLREKILKDLVQCIHSDVNLRQPILGRISLKSLKGLLNKCMDTESWWSRKKHCCITGIFKPANSTIFKKPLFVCRAFRYLAIFWPSFKNKTIG